MDRKLALKRNVYRNQTTDPLNFPNYKKRKLATVQEMRTLDEAVTMGMIKRTRFRIIVPALSWLCGFCNEAKKYSFIWFATKENCPELFFTASSGARMRRIRNGFDASNLKNFCGCSTSFIQEKLFYLTVLTDPTTEWEWSNLICYGRWYYHGRESGLSWFCRSARDQV